MYNIKPPILGGFFVTILPISGNLNSTEFYLLGRVFLLFVVIILGEQFPQPQKKSAMTLFFEMIVFMVAINALMLVFSSNRAK